LLLDENLSERLGAGLTAAFDEVLHVRTEGLGGASDAEIWGFALHLGWPPKVICVGLGNASNAQTASFLLANATTLHAFMDQQECGFLLLQPKP
jgi:predicted nuclease of predicted toxin-antitoxin system